MHTGFGHLTGNYIAIIGPICQMRVTKVEGGGTNHIGSRANYKLLKLRIYLT